MNASVPSSLLAAVEMAPKDPILGVTEAFVADTNPRKINLGVGVYYDDDGKVPLLECVRDAQQALLAKGAPLPYLPIDGIAAYDKAVQQLVFGADSNSRAGGPRGDRAVARRYRLAKGRRRFPAPIPAQRAGLDQRPVLGKPSRAVRRRRLQGQRLPLLRRAHARHRFCRHDRGARRGAGRLGHRPPRVLPQPDRCRSDPGTMVARDRDRPRARTGSVP